LCESQSRRKATELLGRTDAFRPVILAGDGAGVGDLVDVVIHRTGPGTLYGRLAEKEQQQP
jgi:tRNA A37 methylthiotransferase MiaB